MAESAIAHSFLYPFNSTLNSSSERLQLAASSHEGAFPYFFEGRLLAPRTSALMLYALSRVVSTRFYFPPAMIKRMILERDPVVTSGGGMLRFEGFSACCSAYARVDITPDAYDGKVIANGTTNVDFNTDMRAALVSVRDQDRLALSVGMDQIALKHNFESVIEKKVKLPIRWLKGFAEVQAYQSQMEEAFRLSKSETIKFLRSLPANAHSRSVFWVVSAGKGLRLTQTPTQTAVRVGGLERLNLLRDLAPLADELIIYVQSKGEASEWHLRSGGITFCLTITAESSRGFSGEGQILSDITSADQALTGKIRASLKWQSIISLEKMSCDCDASSSQVRQTLSVLGSRGLVGYDLTGKSFFHRELPFNLEAVEDLSPRLKSARKILEGKGVKILSRKNEQMEAEVQGTDVKHRVRADAEKETCTCPWYAKYQGNRGPCKHILAAKIFADGESSI